LNGTFLAGNPCGHFCKQAGRYQKPGKRPPIDPRRRDTMKVILKVFEYKETLEQEFSSLEEANELVNLISKNYPNLRFEPYIEVDESLVLSTS
jgi:hypothetical protein